MAPRSPARHHGRRAVAALVRLPRVFAGIAGFLAAAESPRDGLALARARIAWTRGLRRLAGPPREIDVRVRGLGGPVRLRTHETDPSVLAEIVLHREYEPAIDHAAGPAGDPEPRLVVDLGANIGLASRRFVAAWPGVRVLAVEPDPGNAALLRENLRVAAGGLSRHRVFEACIAGVRRTVRLAEGNGAWGRQMTDAPEPVGDRAVDATDDGPLVTAVTMPDLLAGEPATQAIDLLKCDIEGAEAELFATCREWIDRVRTAVVECHAPYDGERLLADLARNGSDLRIVERHAKPEHGIEVLLLARPAATVVGRIRGNDAAARRRAA